MALSSTYPKLCLCFTATLIILFSLTTLLPHPRSDDPRREESIGEQGGQVKKMVLGSRPPACMNKCLNCRPCQPTLVIPPHKDTTSSSTTTTEDHDLGVIIYNNNNNKKKKRNIGKFEELSHREDGSYYLLSWKCRCGNKIYQP